MYFSWTEFPFIAAGDLTAADRQAPVAIVGAGPVGLVLGLGLARHGIRCVVLESRSTISKGSRALAMNRRSMQILDQLGVGAAVMEKALTWSAGWTFYGEALVHEMNIASPPDEKHGQTNLQQCWMEQLLLDACEKNPNIEIRYRHEVTGLQADEDGVWLEVKTPSGDYPMQARYVVGADGPRGITRRSIGLEYEGTSYSQRFVINDIICRQPLPDGRRLFFSPPYLPGKTVLMHKAPFDMWRLDFQLQDDQDAEEEMRVDKVHQRIRAHFELMGLKPDYELVLTSVYKANAISLPTYNKGRVLFAGDAAHQVPIFGGRGVNHGYADAHNLAWKLALVVKGIAGTDLLDTYTQERRGAILDTLAELTKTTLFITTPSPGIALVREAVLSLSLGENFLNNLFDPYTSLPYEYRDSALNAAPDIDDVFEPGYAPGSLLPDVVLNNSGERLYDHFGLAFVVLTFVEDLANGDGQGVSSGSCAAPAKFLNLPADGRLAKLLDAKVGTTYLIRPDNRVAARWRSFSDATVDAAVARASGRHSLMKEMA
ncbi:MAG: FAD-dependent monooxygenase [Pseudomonadota bacterium]